MVDYCLLSLIAEGVICVGSWPAFCSLASLVANVSESLSSWPVSCLLFAYLHFDAEKILEVKLQKLHTAWTVPAVLTVFNCRASIVGLLLFQSWVCVHVCVLRAGGGTLQNGSPSPTALPWAALMREQALQQELRAQQGLLITQLTPQMHSYSATYNIKRSSAGDGVLVISNNTYV